VGSITRHPPLRGVYRIGLGEGGGRRQRVMGAGEESEVDDEAEGGVSSGTWRWGATAARGR
jgi:hypothetical protein